MGTIIGTQLAVLEKKATFPPKYVFVRIPPSSSMLLGGFCMDRLTAICSISVKAFSSHLPSRTYPADKAKTVKVKAALFSF
jgi:hypothetical protein